MATTFRTPETTTTESRRSTYIADSVVAEPQVHGPVDRPDRLSGDTRPIAPARYPGRWLDRLFHTEPAAPSPRDFVLAQVDPTFTVRSIQR
ncbi:MAG: hypothetical protein OES24_05255 [Acidimicrobiia bacterium]|nr:hypothetical protein [Acidimicrobiia bacterium]